MSVMFCMIVILCYNVYARFVEFNRVLIDHEYGTQAAIGCRHVPTFRQDLISQKLKDILHLL